MVPRDAARTPGFRGIGRIRFDRNSGLNHRPATVKKKTIAAAGERLNGLGNPRDSTRLVSPRRARLADSLPTTLPRASRSWSLNERLQPGDDRLDQSGTPIRLPAIKRGHDWLTTTARDNWSVPEYEIGTQLPGTKSIAAPRSNLFI